MPITLQRRKGGAEVEAALARLQEFAREQAERLGPYADQARDNAARRWYQARGWTAPRLETAALRVEDTLAPRVADLLNAAAQKVEPSPVRRRVRRVPRAAVVVGAGLLGAAAVYGVVRLRQASQDAEWQQNLQNAREQVRETRDQLAAKARETQARLRGVGGDAKEPSDADAAADLNGRVAN
ncbi:hypothetical protein [Marinactinospora rubrisoli]|uniref:Uncharacterized protein n=1 Tax=Marinactinospora rubrisoli TaxID=2715399 RepID=A0ABW2K9U6_9ACTN